MLPNFIIGGGVATGTSFLSAVLASHPDIFLPKIQRPEPNFFHYSWRFNQGLESYQNKYFKEVSSQKAIGERSSLLLTSIAAPKRIKDSISNIKLIFCLRNPIERAWANYRFSVLEGLEELDFPDAIELEDFRRINAKGKWAEVLPNAYLKRSHYAKNLQEYFDLFDESKILLLKSEDLSSFTNDNLKKVYQFLDVDDSLTLPLPPNYSSPSVVDRNIQIELRSYFADRFSSIVECIRKAEDVSTFISSSKDKQKINILRSNLRSSKEPLPVSYRSRLHDLLAKEILDVGKLVPFNIDDWI